MAIVKNLGRVTGYSAYELAVKYGFVGTEEEWLASLKPEEQDLIALGKIEELKGKITEDFLATQEGIEANKEDITIIKQNIVDINNTIEDKADKEHTHSYNDLTDLPTISEIGIDEEAVNALITAAIENKADKDEIPAPYDDTELAGKVADVESSITEINDKLNTLEEKDTTPTDYEEVKSQVEENKSAIENKLDKESISEWALAEEKPAYDYSEIENTPDLSNMVEGIVIHTKEGVEQTATLKDGIATVNMGQLNLYVNDEYQRSFAPGLGGSKISEDGKSFGSFALNLKGDGDTSVSLTASNGVPTVVISSDMSDVTTDIDTVKSDIETVNAELAKHWKELEGHWSAISKSDKDIQTLDGRYVTISETLATKANKEDIITSYNDLEDKPTIPSIEGLATESYVDDAVATLVDSAPEALDTLQELAKALGEDANFATTVSAQIGEKLDKTAISDWALEETKPTYDYSEIENTPNAIESITVHTKEGVEQTVSVQDGSARINMGQLNLFVNGEYQRSFAPGLGGSKVSADGKSFGSFALNLKGEGDTSVSLTAENNIPTVVIASDNSTITSEQEEMATAISNIQDSITSISETVEEKADKTELEGLASEEFVTSKISDLDLDAKLEEKANKEDIITSYNDLEDLPTIPSVEGLASEDYVDEQVADKISGIKVHTREGVEQFAVVEDGVARVNMGQLNLYVNDEFQRSFAPGLGGSQISEDGKSFGSFALNLKGDKATSVNLTAVNGIPTVVISTDVQTVDGENVATEQYVTNQLLNKADAEHNHDDLYVPIADYNALLEKIANLEERLATIEEYGIQILE